MGSQSLQGATFIGHVDERARLGLAKSFEDVWEEIRRDALSRVLHRNHHAAVDFS